jgi:crossover junction endodeoxyribonuclease RuvC
MRKSLGVDVGLSGAAAILIEIDGAVTVVSAIDVPIVGDSAARRVNVLALQEWLLSHGPAFAFCERGRSMPKQGVASVFRYGRSCGSIEAVIQLCGIPLELVEPTKWKKFFTLVGKDKEASRLRAIGLFPETHALLSRKRDHNIAEACLIGLYGLRTSRALVQPAPMIEEAALQTANNRGTP